MKRWFLTERFISHEEIIEKLYEMRIHPVVIRELFQSFQEQIKQSGAEAFSSYLHNLHFQIPEKFKSEQVACELYAKCSQWFDEEVLKLEKELQIPFSVQTEDLKHVSSKVRKVQLVLRQRVTEAVIELK